jgi:hypothetical protein
MFRISPERKAQAPPLSRKRASRALLGESLVGLSAFLALPIYGQVYGLKPSQSFMVKFKFYSQAQALWSSSSFIVKLTLYSQALVKTTIITAPPIKLKQILRSKYPN